MSIDLSIKDRFIISLERCLAREGFIAKFYCRFLSQSASIRDRFAHTDMALQSERLARSLRTLASAVAGEPAGLKELAERADTHSRNKLNITPDMYELWTAAIIAMAREYDPEWSTCIEEAWVHTVNVAVKYMISRA
ncbi:MAG TPA: globin domain-containing protein [Phycisphaerae bacterium]|nr:globin domain-containing protein [Phycisphaerae bacterium]